MWQIHLLKNWRASFYVTNKNCHMWEFVRVHDSPQKMWYAFSKLAQSSMTKISSKPCACLRSCLAHGRSHQLLLRFFRFSTMWIIRNAAIPATILACLQAPSFLNHFVIVYVSTVQSHFWRIWKLVFNVSFVYVQIHLSQKKCHRKFDRVDAA